MTQRRNPIRSTALRRAAANQPCTLEFVGICSYDTETTVLAHIHDETFGRGMKADDTSGVHACYSCHTALDLHKTGLTDAVLLWHVLRALQRTIRNLVERGIVSIPLDTGKPLKQITVKELKDGKLITHKAVAAAKLPGRKPKQPIRSRGFQQGSRPFASKPFNKERS